MDEFAKPISELAGGPKVAVAPSAGLGVSLDNQGRIPSSAPASALPVYASDPVTIVDGMVWLRSDTDELKARVDGATLAFTVPVSTVYPRTVDISVYPTATNTNFDTITLSSTELFGGEKRSTGAQNAEIAWDIVLGAGTWTFELMHSTGTNRGIYTVSFSTDNVTFTDAASLSGSSSTIDGYAAGGATETRSSITGIVIPTTSRYVVRLKMATKNASSSSYLGAIQHVRLWRTA